jgi:hypothetical protein
MSARRDLSATPTGVSSRRVKEKSNVWLPVLLMLAFAATRWPGLLPLNFSAAYALVFCAGVYLPRRLAWWLPLATMLVTDLVLNLYYRFALGIDAFKAMQLVNYAVYAAIIWLGTRFNPRATSRSAKGELKSYAKLLGGGVLGAILFYLVTNTASWFFNPFGNPEYTRNFIGWLTALTKGTAGYLETWEFFRNTLLSGGLFTGLFVGAMKLTNAGESAREKEVPVAKEESDGDAEPEEAKA